MISLMLIPQFGVELPLLMVELLLLIASNCISGTKLQQLFHICKFFYVLAKNKSVQIILTHTQKELGTPLWMFLIFLRRKGDSKNAKR